MPAPSVVACETVDLGKPPADINACRPSQEFFTTEIWPNFLAKDGYAGGAHCHDSACHGAGPPTRSSFTVPPCVPTDPTMLPPLPLTGEWANNYMSVTEQMNCANVAASKLLESPPASRTHGGGKLIRAHGPGGDPHQMWISQP